MKHKPLTDAELRSLEGKPMTALQRKRFEATMITLRGSEGPIREWFGDFWYHFGPPFIFLGFIALVSAVIIAAVKFFELL